MPEKDRHEQDVTKAALQARIIPHISEIDWKRVFFILLGLGLFLTVYYMPQ
ncbi:MAG: hypothetical protein HZC12_03965, partial [Nitrospirae bacterium]|nr:hypothetical protein [Nitrospirota bacterium]